MKSLGREKILSYQEQLANLGYPPGPCDGLWGGQTRAALIAFLDEHLLKTQQPLSAPSTFSVDLVCRIFPGAPRRNIEKYLPFVLQALKDESLQDKDMALMALATIRAETAGFLLISEYKSKYNTSPGGHSFDRYDYRSDLGNQGPPDGERYRGRGFIQLTGRYNYELYGRAIGIDLIDNPERANEPEVAAALLAKFLKDKESKIRAALAKGDLRTARRLVNGGSHGLDRFEAAFKMGQSLLA